MINLHGMCQLGQFPVTSAHGIFAVMVHKYLGHIGTSFGSFITSVGMTLFHPRAGLDQG